VAIDSVGAARPASRWAGWGRTWFVPDRGLQPWAVDGLATAAVAAVQVVGTVSYGADEPSPWALGGPAYALVLAGPAALLFRRRWPEATLAVACAAAAGYAASGYPRGPAGFPAVAFALVSALMMGRRRALAWGVLAVACAGFVGLPAVNPDELEATRSVKDTATNLAWLPLVGAAAEVARVRLERRAEREAAARDEARRRASEERLLIARELHDVLAHDISLINVRSGVALHLLDDRPEQVRPALEAINEASEEALGELRSMLDVLGRGLGADAAPRSPAAGVRDVGALVGRTRAAGVDVDLAVEGEPRPVPAGVDLAAFRIVQEALTNVVRHADGDARVTVRLAYSPADLVVRVDDDGGRPAGAAPSPAGAASPTRTSPSRTSAARTSPARTSPGRGLPGMRERALSLGGAFEAGPRPEGGFRVRARLPLGDGSR
jgi:signal transduction histidine kinase